MATNKEKETAPAATAPGPEKADKKAAVDKEVKNLKSVLEKAGQAASSGTVSKKYV